MQTPSFYRVEIPLSELVQKAQSLTSVKQNQPEQKIQQIVSIDDLRSRTSASGMPQVTLTLCQAMENLECAKECGVKSIIVLEKFGKNLPITAFDAFDNVFLTKNFSWTLSEINPPFQYHNSWLGGGKIHPTAVIDPTAQIGKEVTIGAYTVIGKNVVIGDRAVLGPHCVLEDHVHIGSSTTLIGQIWLGNYTYIGSNCLIHAFVSLGMEGFGFFTAPNGEHKHIPQIGNVVIEDQVEIKTFVAIDRSTLGTTLVKRGSKFDNHCHIAHNCEIGENSLMAGGFMMAGSSRVGKQFMTGGGTLITDHVNVTDNVILAGKSGVTKDITQKGIYGGYPLQAYRDSVKSLANIAELTNMRKQIATIMKHLGLSSSADKGDAHGS